jgi:hypothetical protein
MKPSYFLAIMLDLATVNAAAVYWPRGYTPTPEEHDAAVARAEAQEASLNNTADSIDTRNLHTRSWPTGCVHAHCTFWEDTARTGSAPDHIWISVWHNQQYIFHLTGASEVIGGNSIIQWTAGPDPGNKYVCCQEDECGRPIAALTLYSGASAPWVVVRASST